MLIVELAPLPKPMLVPKMPLPVKVKLPALQVLVAAQLQRHMVPLLAAAKACHDPSSWLETLWKLWPVLPRGSRHPLLHRLQR